jgi:hypothetical protein
VSALRWREIRAAEDAAVLALAHKALCERARRLMPLLPVDFAGLMRRAMLEGPGSNLMQLVDQAEEMIA